LLIREEWAVQCRTTYDCFTHWWAALPAIPPDAESLDWWAIADGRTTRYRRLKRLWFDSTRLLAPREDPLRPHEFARPTHGTHVTCKVWENFVLLHPRDWIHPLMGAAGLVCPIVPADCAWSYEYEAMVGGSSKFKLADIVVHVRDEVGHDVVLVIEAKRPGDRLKENGELPDTRPGSYLDREAFQPYARRFMIYLVDDAYLPTVRVKVSGRPGTWGVISWSQLERLQRSLVQNTYPGEAGLFLSEVIATCHASLRCRCWPDPQPDLLRRGVELLDSLDDTTTPRHVREYVAGAVQHLHCLSGLAPATLAFSYLAKEPSFGDVHGLLPGLRQKTPERRAALWRLPMVAGNVAEPGRAAR
jgi:hypothetical protein